MHIPLLLTFLRCIASLFIPFIVVFVIPYSNLWYNSLLGAMITLLCCTDFFDGYYARKYNQVSILGALLDPLADKLLFISLLIPFVVLGKLYYYWAIIFIMREFFVMSLRIIALEYSLGSIAVSYSAKVKTLLQMIYCIVVIVLGSTSFIVSLLLYAALLVSVISAYQYCQQILQRLSRV